VYTLLYCEVEDLVFHGGGQGFAFYAYCVVVEAVPSLN